MLFGDAGDDVVFGGEGNDRLSGGTGNDQLDGETSVDVARFETGFDHATLTWNDDGTLTVTTAATGTDTLQNVELLRFDDRVVLAQAPKLVKAPVMVFEESFYQAHNPDVADAVAHGDYASGYAHYVQYGAREGRTTAERGVAFDEAYYLSKNPDVDAAIQAGDIIDAYTHYSLYGQGVGRVPNALFDES